VTSLAALSVHDLLDVLARPVPAPGGGSVAALAAASAAALVERCAGVSAQPELAWAGARAQTLREELLELADRDACALAAFAGSAGELRTAAAVDASGPPALLRAAAEEIAELATTLEREGPISYRGEASCARVLATAAASVAQTIVVMNLAYIARQS
jgi:methenyltetrahydrofolate cyclohydrolase